MRAFVVVLVCSLILAPLPGALAKAVPNPLTPAQDLVTGGSFFEYRLELTLTAAGESCSVAIDAASEEDRQQLFSTVWAADPCVYTGPISDLVAFVIATLPAEEDAPAQPSQETRQASGAVFEITGAARAEGNEPLIDQGADEYTAAGHVAWSAQPSKPDASRARYTLQFTLNVLLNTETHFAQAAGTLVGRLTSSGSATSASYEITPPIVISYHDAYLVCPCSGGGDGGLNGQGGGNNPPPNSGSQVGGADQAAEGAGADGAQLAAAVMRLVPTMIPGASAPSAPPVTAGANANPAPAQALNGATPPDANPGTSPSTTPPAFDTNAPAPPTTNDATAQAPGLPDDTGIYGAQMRGASSNPDDTPTLNTEAAVQGGKAGTATLELTAFNDAPSTSDDPLASHATGGARAAPQQAGAEGQPARDLFPAPVGSRDGATRAGAGTDGAGNALGSGAKQAATEGQAITGAPTSGARALAIATLAAAVTALALLGAAFYARLAPSQLTQNEMRRRILDHIRANPGVGAFHLAQAMGKRINGVQHHLRKLTQAGLVASREESGMERFFIPGDARMQAALAQIQRETPRARLAAAVASRPGICLEDAAQEAGLGYKTAHYHVQRMAQEGMLRVEREQRKLCLSPA